MNKIIIHVRRWVDGSNTYHSVKIIDGENIIISNHNYGYGRQFQSTAATLLNVEYRELNDHTKYEFLVKDVRNQYTFR